MAGGVKVCIEASNEPCIHQSASDVACRDTLDQWQYCGQAVKMTHNHGTRCKSVHLAAVGMSCTLKEKKFCDCEILGRAWEGVYTSALKRAMSLASTNPHHMLRAEKALDHWHCCGQAVKMTHNHGTRLKSVHLAAVGMSCTLEKTKKTLIVKFCIGHGRVCKGLY